MIYDSRPSQHGFKSMIPHGCVAPAIANNSTCSCLYHHNVEQVNVVVTQHLRMSCAIMTLTHSTLGCMQLQVLFRFDWHSFLRTTGPNYPVWPVRTILWKYAPSSYSVRINTVRFASFSMTNPFRFSTSTYLLDINFNAVKYLSWSGERRRLMSMYI